MINNFIKNTFVKNFLISKLISIRSLGSWILSTLLLYTIYLFCKIIAIFSEGKVKSLEEGYIRVNEICAMKF